MHPVPTGREYGRSPKNSSANLAVIPIRAPLCGPQVGTTPATSTLSRRRCGVVDLPMWRIDRARRRCQGPDQNGSEGASRSTGGNFSCRRTTECLIPRTGVEAGTPLGVLVQALRHSPSGESALMDVRPHKPIRSRFSGAAIARRGAPQRRRTIAITASSKSWPRLAFRRNPRSMPTNCRRGARAACWRSTECWCGSIRSMKGRRGRCSTRCCVTWRRADPGSARTPT